MKIIRIAATRINAPLKGPYGWVYGELPGVSQSVIQVETDDGLVDLRMTAKSLSFNNVQALAHSSPMLVR